MECLFVGGTNDGERIDVTDGIRDWNMPVKSKEPALLLSTGRGVSSHGVERYVISTFYATEERPGYYHNKGKQKEFVLYKLEGMTSIDLMQSLINGYGKGK